MNRNRRQMSKQNRKAIQKETKKGQTKLTQKEKVPRTDTLSPKQALNKYPKKIKKIEKPLMESVANQMQIKKKKMATFKKAKRTTPGDVRHRETPPEHIHPENERWKIAVDKQNIYHRKELTRKLQRRKGKK